jgi:hypothetical protein
VIRPFGRPETAYKACVPQHLPTPQPLPVPSFFPLPLLSLPLLFFIETTLERERMRSLDPTLPSITFVLSQAQPPAAHRSSKRWNRFGVRRSKSSPSFAPHPPRYPPRLDSEFLTVNPSFLYPFAPPPHHLPYLRSVPISEPINGFQPPLPSACRNGDVRRLLTDSLRNRR